MSKVAKKAPAFAPPTKAAGKREDVSSQKEECVHDVASPILLQGDLREQLTHAEAMRFTFFCCCSLLASTHLDSPMCHALVWP